MHLFDVEEAIERVDLHGLRHAFAILIHYPHLGHIEGARTATRLIDLFDRITSALEGDQAPMPDAMGRAIACTTSVPVAPAAPFSHGAIIAAEFRHHWHGAFHASADHARAA